MEILEVFSSIHLCLLMHSVVSCLQVTCHPLIQTMFLSHFVSFLLSHQDTSFFSRLKSFLEMQCFINNRYLHICIQKFCTFCPTHLVRARVEIMHRFLRFSFSKKSIKTEKASLILGKCRVLNWAATASTVSGCMYYINAYVSDAFAWRLTASFSFSLL